MKKVKKTVQEEFMGKTAKKQKKGPIVVKQFACCFD